MSRHFAFNFEEERSEAAAIEAVVLMRGGRLLEDGAGVVLAVLENRPIAIRLDGPRAGTYITLSKTGVGRRQNLPDRGFLDTADVGAAKVFSLAVPQVVDLVEGEERLQKTMQAILTEVQPQIAALLAAQAQDPSEAEQIRAGSPDARSRRDCFEAMAVFLDTGRPGSCLKMPEIVQELLKGFLDVACDLPGDDAKRADLAMAHLVLATPGLGKMRSVLSLIEALPKEAVVWVAQPTLKKAHEFARDMAGSSRPVHVFRGRGAPVSDGASQRMCQRHAAAAELAAKGLPVKSTLCGSTEAAEGASCPYAKDCAYLAQIKALKDHRGGGVFVLTHASLTQPPPCAEPHLVIIDEDPSAHFPQNITVGAESLGIASGWAAHLTDACDEPGSSGQTEDDGLAAFEDDEKNPEAVIELCERLLDSMASAAPLQEIAANNMVSEFEAALKLLRGLERKLRGGLKPGLADQALSEILADSAIPELQSVQAVLSAILAEVRLTVAGAIDRAGFNGISISRNKNGQVQSVTAHRLARLAIKSSVPMIVLDGTADPILMGRALRRRMAVSRIDLKRQGEVVQCLGRGFSTASLAPTVGYPIPASMIVERDHLWQGLETVLRREVAAAPNGVLVVSTLAVETEGQLRRCCADLLGGPLAWTHFGATRGINAFTERQTVVLIGRKQPPASALQAVARAYFAGDPKPFEPGGGDYIVRRRTLRDKSGKSHSTVIQMHPDSRVNRILWQTREAEVIQAIDRVRSVRFVRRIVILNALDLRRLEDDPENPDLGLPADRHLSWPEFRNGGNRAEAVLEASGGFLPVAPKALVHIAPEIFPSLEAAKKWLHRTDLTDALASHADSMTHVHVRPEGQRGASWPLIVDQRRQGCLSAARLAFEALVGAEMAVWQVFEGHVSGK
jgi:hypothetical protein